MTGPAIVNILTAVPVTNPSLFASMAGEATALANPVIGTSVPAPATRAILSNTPMPVKSPAANTNVTVTQSAACFSDNPQKRYKLFSACPIQQINPPIKNAKMLFLRQGERLARRSAYCLYALRSISNALPAKCFLLIQYGHAGKKICSEADKTIDFFAKMNIIYK